MRSIIRFARNFLTATLVATFALGSFVSPALAATQTIQGTAAAGNLAISVYDNGAMRVQMYSGATWGENIYGLSAKGSTLCLGTTRYDMGGNSTWAPGAGGTVATPTGNSGGGTFTLTSSWTMGGGINVVQTTSYTCSRAAMRAAAGGTRVSAPAAWA
jgi:hypothetical protein